MTRPAPAFPRRAAVLAAALILALPAAHPGTASAAESASAAAHPYDEDADAHQAVDAALAAGHSAGKRVLIDFGANWCPDCRVVASVMAEPAMRQYDDAHFVRVLVDVGRMNKNIDLAQRFGINLTHIPTIVVVAPDGTVTNRTDAETLSNARSMEPAAVRATLQRWATGSATAG